MTRYSKFLVAIATGIAQVIALGLVEGDAALWAMVVLAVFGSFGVYAVPNTPPAGEPADPAMSEQHVAADRGQSTLGIAVAALVIACVALALILL